MRKTFSGLFVLAVGMASQANAFSCDVPPAAITDFNTISYYVDAHHSVVDPAREAQEKADTKPVDDFEKQIAKDAHDYAAREKSDAGQCALSWLSQWAGSGAFLGRMESSQAYYTQKWLLASTALSYARVRPIASPAQSAQIEGWFRALADRVIEHTEHSKERNNHYYWDGLAVAAVGSITGDRRYLDFATGVFDTAMTQINSDGALPLELARAAKASSYHSFATEALVMLSSILNRDSPQLDKLVAYTCNALQNPAAITAAAGFPQEPLKPQSLEWLKIYLRRHPNAQMEALVASVKPGLNARLGGYLDPPNPLEHTR